MEHRISDQAKSWFEKRNVNIASIALFAMHVVEDYSQRVHGMHGADKLSAAIGLLPRIVYEARMQGLIDKEQCEHYIEFVTNSSDTMVAIIETCVAVSKNPTLVQFVDELGEKCCAKKRTKNE